MHHRVLVVDDEDTMRRMLTRALSGVRCWCASTGTGEEAVELLDLEQFDLAVIDKNLPGISGIEVARRALGAERPVPVIMVTGYPSEESKQEAQNLGISSYLTKPFGLYQLQRTVSVVLEAHADQKSAEPGGFPRREAPTEPPPGFARITASRAFAPRATPRARPRQRIETDVAFAIVEPDLEIRDRLLTVMTDAGYRAVAFGSRQQAESHVERVGYDVLIAGPEVLDQTRHWARIVPNEAPLGAIAIVESGDLAQQIYSIRDGVAGVLIPPFDTAMVIHEIRRAIAKMREQQRPER